MKAPREYTIAALSIAASLTTLTAFASLSTSHDPAHNPLEIVEVVERYYVPKGQNELSLSGLSQRYSEGLAAERASALSEAVMLAFEATGIELELARAKVATTDEDVTVASVSDRQIRVQYSALRAPVAGLSSLNGQALTF